MNDLIKRLRERAEKIRGYITSSQRVVELLQPEWDKFRARTGHDTYTVRMYADHTSSIRTQTKEADEYTEAADRLTAMKSAGDGLEDALGDLLGATEEVGYVHYAPFRAKARYARSALKQWKEASDGL